MQKFLRTLMLLALMLPFASQAQNSTLTVADSTATNQYVPVYGNYMDDPLGCQSIYPASMLTDMVGESILSLRYYVSSGNSTSWGNKPMLVKMMIVTEDDLADGYVDISTATTVYDGYIASGDATVADGFTVELTTPFAYNGGNLLVSYQINPNDVNGYTNIYWYGINLNNASRSGYGSTNYNFTGSGTIRNFLPKTTFTYGAAPTCFRVTDLAIDATQTTANSLTLTWTDALNTGATYSVYTVTPTDTTLVQSGINALTYTVTGLDANTTYAFAVMSDCGAGDVTALTAPVSGRTACAATSLPYSENFGGYTGLQTYPYNGPSVTPSCWSYYSNGTNTVETTGTSYFGGVAQYTSTYSYGCLVANNPYLCMPIQITGASVTSSTYIGYETARGNTKFAVLPSFAEDLSGLQISFDYKMSSNYSTTGAATTLELGYITTDTASFVSMVSYQATTTVQHISELNLTTLAAAAPDGARLAFKFSGVHNGTGSYDYTTVYAGIDNILVEELPACVRVSNLTVNSVTASSITLSWADATNSGATYSVYIITPADTTLVEDNIAGTTYTVTDLNADQVYAFAVQANCGSEDAAMTLVSGRTACATETMPWSENFDNWTEKSPCWSFMSGLYNGGNGTPATAANAWTLNSTYGDHITLSGKALTMNLYSDLRYWAVTPAIEITDDNAALSVDIAVAAWSAATPNYDDNDTLAFAISTNGGTTWTNLMALDGTALNALSNTYTSVIVPVTGYSGQTVRFAIYGGSISGTNPYDNRMVIDNVSVDEAPACMPISNLTVDSVSAEVAMLSWSGDASGYVIYDMSDTTVYQYASDTVVELYALDANTLYTFGVAADCGGSESPMVTISFRTPCTAIELPYTENFEANGNFPCWTKVNCHASTGLGTSNPYSGTGCLYFNYNYNPPQYVISPELSGVDNGLQLSFMYRAYGSNWTETFNVGFSTTTNDTAAFVWSDQVSTNSTTYAEYSQMMPAGTKYVAIRYTAYNQYYLYIDSMVFTPMEDDYCFPVANLAVDSVSANSISLSWVGNASNYVFLNMANGTEFTATADGNSVTIDGLNANTLYTIGVAVVCASGNSDTVTISGRTACAAIDSLPYTMGFENADLQSTTGATSLLFPFCWTRINNSTSDYYNYYPYAYNYGTPNNGSRHLYFNASTYGTYADTTGFVMPALDVETYPMDANRVTFWAKVSSASTPYKVIVGTMSTPADMSTFTVADTVTVANTDYAMYAVSLATAEATDAYVAFLVPKVASSMYIDDVTLEPQPNCADVTGLTLDSMMTTTAYISWNDVDADSYEVEVRQGDSVITDANVLVENDTTATISDLSLDNDYQIYVRSVCGGDYGAWAPALNIHVGYCQPNPTSRDGQGIIGVAFGGMTNTSSHPTAAPYYINNASMMGYVPAGTTATVDITYATAYTYGTIIWVDWNNSLTFDANEVVYAGVSTNTNPTTLSATFAIPANQATGNYRMRIAGADSYFDDYTASLTAASAANPCFTSSYAVAEDYTLVVIDALTCPMVSNVYDDSLTTDGAMLHWTGNDDAVSYRIYAMADTTLVATVTDTFAVLTGLDANTVYTYGVASACSGNDESPVVTVTFRTACSAIALPYTEDFENGIDCWRLVDCEPNTKVWTNNPYSGTSCFGFTYNLNPPQYLISPEFTGGDNGVDLSFMYRVENSSYAESFVVGYSTTTNDTAAFIWGVEQTGLTNLTYAAHSEYLPAGTKYVAIKYTANNMWRLYIDSMVFSPMSANFCFPVTGLTVDSTTGSSVTLSWIGDAASYSIYNGTTYVGSTSDTNYTVSGLTASTAYTFGVTAVCSATDSADMVTVSATTGCAGESCLITVSGTDAYNDGWDGAMMTISQNGVTVGTFTVNAASNTATYSVCSGAPVTFSWTVSSEYYAYPDDISFTITDGGGATVHSLTDATNMTDGVFFTLADACPSCVAPVVTLDTVTTTTATISWTSTATSFNVYNGTTAVATGISANTYTFTGLTAGTAYTFGVEAICGAGDTSAIATVNAQTEFDCSDITTLPYLETFEAGALGCWTTVNSSTDPTAQPWQAFNATSMQNITAHSGTYVAAAWSWSGNAMNSNTWMISPKFVLPTVAAGDTLLLSWWELVSANYPDNYSVELSTTTNDVAAFTTNLRPLSQGAGTWTLRTVDLTAYAGQSIYVAFHHVDYNNNYLFIDDISMSVGAAPVPAPDTLNVTLAVANATMGTTNPAPGTYQYITGDTVRINAVPNAGYHFVGWEYTNGTNVDTLGAEYISTYFPANIFMSYGSMTFTALFEAGNPDSTTITYAVNDATMGSINPAGTQTIYVGNTIQAEATANAGYELYAWVLSIAVGSNNNTDTIFSNSADFANPMIFGTLPQSLVDDSATITITALFQASTVADTYTVTVNVNNAAMGSVTGAPTAPVAEGTTVTLVAVANAGHRFVDWSNGLTNDTITITVNSDTTLTANFEAIPTYTVTTVVNPANSGSITGAPTTAVLEGSEVVLTAVPAAGYHFVNWSNGSTTATIQVTVTSDTTLTANFEANPVGTYTVAVNYDATMGTVTGIPAEAVTSGTEVTLTATANTGFHFVSWSTGATTETITITVTSDTVLSVTFEANAVETYEVRVLWDATMGNVTGVPEGPVAAGTSVTLMANPLEGYQFVAWMIGEDTVGHNAVYTIDSVSDNVTLVALFAVKTGIEDVEMSNVKIYSAESVIYVMGAEGQNVYLYDLNGRVINAAPKAGERVEFRMNNTGVYLVKVGTAAAKRVVVTR